MPMLPATIGPAPSHHLRCLYQHNKSFPPTIPTPNPPKPPMKILKCTKPCKGKSPYPPLSKEPVIPITKANATAAENTHFTLPQDLPPHEIPDTQLTPDVVENLLQVHVTIPFTTVLKFRVGSGGTVEFKATPGL